MSDQPVANAASPRQSAQPNQPQGARFSQGVLVIPNLWVEDTGTEHTVEMRLIPSDPLRFEVLGIDPPLPGKPADGAEPVTFTCNLCGETVTAPRAQVQDRETPACPHCGSSLRFRALMLVLSERLFGRTLTLPEFPDSPAVVGAGMSDSPSYAVELARKFDYTNTFFHTEPKLDITEIPEDWANRFDFLISSEVFEHLPQPVDRAFHNVFRLLKPGGVLIFSVPYKKHGATEEHFPELYDYRLEERNGRQVLINVTELGEHQEFTDLCFHGGEGFTLEMRLFSAPHLELLLREAGFEDIRFHRDEALDFGVAWGEVDWSLPISARKPT